MSTLKLKSWRSRISVPWFFLPLVATVYFAVWRLAPAEATMGPSQRILYIHVSVAWFSLFAFVVMAVTGMLYLRQRDLKWDAWAHAAAELGWLCCGLTLLSGSLWAHEAWGTWWSWDPRLTTSFVLWLIYTGILMARHTFGDVQLRARTCAIISLLGLVDIPLVTMATRWFRGIHPVSPEMEPAMRLVLLITVACVTTYLCGLLVKRQTQIRREYELALPETFAEHSQQSEPDHHIITHTT